METILSNFNVRFCLFFPGSPDTGDVSAQPEVGKPEPVNKAKVSSGLFTAEDPVALKNEVTDLKPP